MILAAYRKWGRNFGSHVAGDYAAALWDPHQNTCLLVRDPMGVRSLYYAANDNRFIFATSISGILSLLSDAPEVSTSRLVNYLSGISHDWCLPPYEEIYKVQPGQNVGYSAGTLKTREYFAFSRVAAVTSEAGSDYVTPYKRLLDQAVVF